MLQGPFNLTAIIIEATIKNGQIGAYILSRGNNAAHYVGRSDNDIKARLKQHLTEGKYSQFWIEIVNSPLDAYYLECEWYHKYKPTDNINHPATLPGSAWKCPVSGCQWSL